MELAAGRDSKDSSSGRGGSGSDSGRYSRSEREKGSAGGARDYAREGGGGRSGERDRERDSRRGGEKQRRKDDSRGGGGSSRGYSDRREDRGYRYSSHRDRSSRCVGVLFCSVEYKGRERDTPRAVFPLPFGKLITCPCSPITCLALGGIRERVA